MRNILTCLCYSSSDTPESGSWWGSGNGSMNPGYSHLIKG
nr:MAG TPA: hypothetical protein [Caudoviricetes sp.]